MSQWSSTYGANIPEVPGEGRGAQTVSLSITMRHLAAQTAIQTMSSEQQLGWKNLRFHPNDWGGSKQTCTRIIPLLFGDESHKNWSGTVELLPKPSSQSAAHYSLNDLSPDSFFVWSRSVITVWTTVIFTPFTAVNTSHVFHIEKQAVIKQIVSITMASTTLPKTYRRVHNNKRELERGGGGKDFLIQNSQQRLLLH